MNAPPAMLSKLLAVQQSQQDFIHGNAESLACAGPLWRDALSDKMCKAFFSELSELQSTLGKDGWEITGAGRRAPASREERLYALADLFKCFLALACSEGANAAELEDYFFRKTAIVEDRVRSARWRPEGHAVIAFDIDGVLARKVDWWPTEEEFIASGRVGFIPLNGVMADLLHLLQRHRSEWTEPISVVLMTSRKRKLYPDVEYQTLQWLKRHNIGYDKLIWTYDKGTELAALTANRILAFEDSPKHAQDLSKAGCWVVYMGDEAVPQPNEFFQPTGEGNGIGELSANALLRWVVEKFIG